MLMCTPVLSCPSGSADRAIADPVPDTVANPEKDLDADTGNGSVVPDPRAPVVPRPCGLELRGEREQRRLAAGRPTSIIPIGRPSALQYSGSEIAGWPVML